MRGGKERERREREDDRVKGEDLPQHYIALNDTYIPYLSL